jgi:hypothetical protein
LSARRLKNWLNTSFRSVIQATDSAWIGCTANKAATNALGHRCPVALKNR